VAEGVQTKFSTRGVARRATKVACLSSPTG
jgi:hypothetical protein